MVSEHHIRQALGRYLSGEVSLPEFQEWFAPRAWEVVAEHGPAMDLVGQIELVLAEFTGGYQTEVELRTALKQHADTSALVILIEDFFIADRWTTGVVGVEFGNSNTVEVGGSLVVHSPHIQVSKEPVAA